MRIDTRINGYDFEWISDSDEYGNEGWYQCRGEVCYDDDHDQTPEPGLWEAVSKLQEQVSGGDYRAEAQHSEKGWVELLVTKIGSRIM